MLSSNYYLSIREMKRKNKENVTNTFSLESFLFDSIEDEDVHSIKSLSPRKSSICWMILYYIVCVLSICVYPYILSFKPVWRSYLKTSKSSLEKCNIVFVKSGYDKQRTVCRVRRYNDIRYFTYRYVNFVILEDEDGEVMVKKVQFELKEKPSEKSFLLMESVKDLRRVLFGKNQIKIDLETNIIRLFISELLHPFFLFQIFSILLWLCDNYYIYAGIILFFAAFSICMTIFSLRKNRLEMKKRFESQNFEVTRLSSPSLEDENFVSLEKVNTTDLIPGDIIELGENGRKRIPCDIVILESECYVNEAILTGESKPVLKIESEEGTELSKNNVVYGGTKLVKKKGTVLGMVYKTGFQTKKGELIASILFTKPEVSFEFYRDSVKFILIMCVVGFISFCITLYRLISYHTPVFSIIKRGLDVFTIIIPPALPIAIEEGMSVSIRQLKGSQISCLFPEKINVAGKISTFCFDKTGTLTEDELSLEKTIEGNDEEEEERTGQKQSPSVDILRCFGYCHSLTKVKKEDLENDDDDDIVFDGKCGRIMEKMKNYLFNNMIPESWKRWALFGEEKKRREIFFEDEKSKEYVLEGDPLDLCLFVESGMDLDPETNEIIECFLPHTEVEIREKNERESQQVVVVIEEEEVEEVDEPIIKKAEEEEEEEEPSIIPLRTRSTKLDQIFAFESKFQRMTVVTSDGVVYTKGSPEMVRKLCIPSTLPPNFSEILVKYAKRGYRMIACSKKLLPSKNRRSTNMRPPSDITRSRSPSSSGKEEEEEEEEEEMDIKKQMEVDIKNETSSTTTVVVEVMEKKGVMMKEEEEEEEGGGEKKIMKYEREDVEKDMEFIGFAIVTNNLKDKSVETIEVLKKAKINSLMVTGDNPLTATTVALKCNILEQPVDLKSRKKEKIEYNNTNNTVKFSIIDDNNNDDEEEEEEGGRGGGGIEEQFSDDLDLNEDYQSPRNRIVMIKKKTREDDLVFVDYESGMSINPPKDFQIPETLKEPEEEDNIFLEEGGEVNEASSIFRNGGGTTSLYNDDGEKKKGIEEVIFIEEDSSDEEEEEEEEGEGEEDEEIRQQQQNESLLEDEMILDPSQPEAEYDGTDQYVVTGPAFRIFREDKSGLYHQLLTSSRLRVFSRMSPIDKFNLVCDIRDRRKEMGYVGFCGDGTNDCAAIKRSDCGVSVAVNSEVSLVSHFCLSLAEKSKKSWINKVWIYIKSFIACIFKPLYWALVMIYQCFCFDPEAVTEEIERKKNGKKKGISSVDCVPFIIKTSKSSLQTSFSIFKFIIIYSVVQTTVVLWLYFLENNLNDPMFLYVDILIIFPVCILMGETPPKDELVEYIPKSSLISVGVIGSVLFQTFCYIILSVFCWMVLIRSPGFEYNESKSHSLDYESCQEVSAMFFVCVFGTLAGAVSYTITKPFKQSVLQTNRIYVSLLVGLYALSTLLMFFDNSLTQWMVGDPIPGFVAFFFCFAFYLHLAVVYLVEYVFFSFLQVETSQ